jgi:hypothetical protein
MFSILTNANAAIGCTVTAFLINFNSGIQQHADSTLSATSGATI